MADDTYSATYVVTAKARSGLVQQTRSMAASAVVLAQSLREAGYTDIQVTDPAGNLLSPEGSGAGWADETRASR